ncbi:MAG: dTMP kinase [Desulfopila sp.]
MNHSLPGRLIVFEGIDGTGKSTQAKLLGDFLRHGGYQVLVTREPTDGEYGQKIRKLYSDRTLVSKKEELELFLADRRQHVETELIPALTAGQIVVCDRYFLSTIAYQGANGFACADLLRRNSFAPDPDLALILEVSTATSRRRITSGRGERPNAFEQEEMLDRVSALFARLDLPYIRRIDAETPVEAIHREVVSAVRQVLPQPVLSTSVAP